MTQPLIKIPYAIKATVAQSKLMAQYLDFKLYNPQGRIIPKEYGRFTKNRVTNKYWLDKLVSAGWAYKDSTGAYCLRSYKYVWNLLNVDTTSKNNYRGEYIPFFKVSCEDLSLDKKSYIKELTEILIERTANTHRKQMKYKQRTRLTRSGENLEFFSCRASAKLFGFKHPLTGNKYRAKYFEVTKSERILHRTSFLEHDKYNGAEFLYKCDKIAL